MVSAYAPKKEEICGYKTYFREVGNFITRREQFERALKYYDEALSKTPDDYRALIGRSWARAKACQYQGALHDVNKALKLDKEDLVFLAHKALNTYLSCEFEDALVQNLRHLPKRKKPDNFVMGVMHCNEAIENCIGIRAGNPLRDHYRIIRKLAWKMAFAKEKPYEPKSKYKKKKKKAAAAAKLKAKSKGKAAKSARSAKSLGLLAVDMTKIDELMKVPGKKFQESAKNEINVTSGLPFPDEKEEGKLEIRESLYTHNEEEDLIPPGIPFPFRPLQKHTSNLKNYMSEKYLDAMYLDKIFLADLKYTAGVKGPNQEGYKKIVHLAKSGYKTLSYKQELLRTRRPFYFIKYQEATSSGELKIRQERELTRLREIAKDEAEGILSKIVQCLRDGNTQGVFEFAEKLRNFCDSKSRKVLLDREAFLDKMYELVCLGHFMLKRLNTEQSSEDQEKRIFVMFGMAVSREPSTDSVIRQYKAGFIDYKKQIWQFEERLKKAQTSQERAWIYHELARFTCELKQYEMSRVYARKCIQEGRECDNLRWVVNAMILITRVTLQQKNKNDAKSEMVSCVEVAKIMNDQKLIRFLTKCIQVIEKMNFEGVRSSKVLEKREKQILDILQDSQVKDEAAFLFRQMAGLPASRRMSVMPGIKIDADGVATKVGKRKTTTTSTDDEDM